MPIITSNISGYGSNSPIQISGSIVFANSQTSGSDTAFFVSGSNTTRAVFAGTMVVSGSLVTSGSTFLGDNINQDIVQIKATTSLQGLTSVGTTTTTGLLTVSGSATSTTPTLVVRGGVASPTGPVIDVQSNAGTSLIHVSGSGNVGIGTVNASQMLHLHGGSLLVNTTGTGTNNDIYIGRTGGWATNETHSLNVHYNSATSPSIGGTMEFLYDGTKQNINFRNLFNAGANTNILMSIAGNGNVGIGSSTPASRFVVSGSSTAATPTMVVREGVVSATGGVGTFDVQNSAGTSLLFVSGSGNVGIGASRPAGKLDVTGVSGSLLLVTDTITGSLFSVNNVSGLPLFEVFSDSRIFAGGYNTNALAVSGSRVAVGTIPTNTISLLVSGSSTSADQAMVVKAGVAAPTTNILDIQSNTGVSYLTVSGSGNVGVGTSSFTGRFFVSGSSTAAIPTMIVREGVAVPFGGVGTFDVQNSAGTSLLFVSGSGTVGINTNNPQSAQLYVSSSLTGNAASALIIGGQVLGVSLNTYKGQTQLFQLANGTTEVMRLNSAANVGIGTGTYTARLFVSGSSTATTPTIVARGGVASPTGPILDVQNYLGATILVASGSGNVGIGTSNPTAPLNVFGTSTAAPSSTVGIVRFLGSATNALIFGTLTDSPFSSYVQSGGSGTYPLSLNPLGGNVGIGTTTNLSTLTVNGGFSAKSPSTVNASTYSVTTTDYSLRFTTTDCTVTLPTASSFPGRILIMNTITANSVTSNASNVIPLGSDTAGTSILAATLGKFTMIQSNGTNWVTLMSN